MNRISLPPANFEENIAALNKKWCGPDGFPEEVISAEQGMSCLMYPKVFSDYMARRRAKGRCLQYLPTPVYFYGMVPGQRFLMTVPAKLMSDITKIPETDEQEGHVAIELKRVCPLKDGQRKIVFEVNGKEQHCDIKDSSGAFVFEGPMADPANVNHVGSPMPGLVEKLLVAEGSKVKAGDTLCTISAMKMEVLCRF